MISTPVLISLCQGRGQRSGLRHAEVAGVRDQMRGHLLTGGRKGGVGDSQCCEHG